MHGCAKAMGSAAVSLSTCCAGVCIADYPVDASRRIAGRLVGAPSAFALDSLHLPKDLPLERSAAPATDQNCK
jgi:hypothetical protein